MIIVMCELCLRNGKNEQGCIYKSNLNFRTLALCDDCAEQFKKENPHWEIESL